jgi:hypothetical protein
MSSLRNVNPSQHSAMLSSVVAYWTRAQVVMESNPGLNNIVFNVSCSRHAIVFTLYKERLCQSCAIFENLLPYIIYDPILIGASVVPTSEVRSPSVLVLPVVRNQKV